MTGIRNRMLEFFDKMTLKQVIIYTFLEMIFFISLGFFVSIVIPEFKSIRYDYVLIVVAVDLFETVSIMKARVLQDGRMSEVLHWIKFSIFSTISILYLMIILEFRQIAEIKSYFANLDITLILIMILMLGVDLTIDKLNDMKLEEGKLVK